MGKLLVGGLGVCPAASYSHILTSNSSNGNA